MLGRGSLDEKISTLRFCDDVGESCKLEVHEITDGLIDAQEWSAAEKESARALVAAAVKRRAESGASDASGGRLWWLSTLPAIVAVKNVANAVAPEVVEETTTSVGKGVRTWWGRRSQAQRYGLFAGGAFSLCFVHLALDESQCLSVTSAVALPFGSELCDLATHLGRFTKWLSSKALTLLMLIAALVTGGGGGGGGNGVGRRAREAGAVAVGTAIEAVVAVARWENWWEVQWLPILLGAVTLAGAWCLRSRPASQARQPPQPVQPQTPPPQQQQPPPAVKRSASSPPTSRPTTPHTGPIYAKTRNVPLSLQQPPPPPPQPPPRSASPSVDRARLSVPVLQKDLRKVLGAGAKLPKTKEELVEMHRRHGCGS